MPRLRLPRSLWIALATVALIIAGTGLRIGVPAYRRRATLVMIRERCGIVESRRNGPEWLREWIGEGRMSNFDDIEGVQFRPDLATFKIRVRHGFYLGVDVVADPGVATIDDPSLAMIRRLPRLKRLDLDWTNVGDTGMQHVAALTELEELYLRETDVSDACIPILAGLTMLKQLDLTGTRMTDEGVAKLRAALPKCEIFCERP